MASHLVNSSLICSTCQPGPGGVTDMCARGVNKLNVLTESMYTLTQTKTTNKFHKAAVYNKGKI